MKFTLKITPIGVTLFTVLVITQVLFAILAIAKAITWKLIFVLLPTIILVIWGSLSSNLFYVYVSQINKRRKNL